MKKMIGTKVKCTIAGQLAFATAMIFSLPGNMLAQQTQTITAPSIADVIYSTTSISVAATSSSGLAVKYGVAGPATLNSSGSLTMIGKGAESCASTDGDGPSKSVQVQKVRDNKRGPLAWTNASRLQEAN